MNGSAEKRSPGRPLSKHSSISPFAQCINYLKASHLRLALLFNFQKPKVEWKRIVYG
jgi:GxxExxY protein